MSTENPEICCGRKTFFIVPEVSLLPEEYLKSYFLKGFETYFIDDDPYCSLDLKIHTLVSMFKEIILFINIDRPIHGIVWPIFIRKLKTEYGDRVIIGVMYRRKTNFEEAHDIERQYLYDIGISGGCIPVEYQKTKNLYNFLNVLIANQANGQRKFLRAICDDSFKMNFKYQGVLYKCVLRDISISHFSCVFSGDIAEMPLHERIDDIQLNLKGVHLNVDGVVSLKRAVGEDMVHVFVFRTEDGREGLDPDNMAKINELIYRYFMQSMLVFLRERFTQARARSLQRPDETPPANDSQRPDGELTAVEQPAGEPVAGEPVAGELATGATGEPESVSLAEMETE